MNRYTNTEGSDASSSSSSRRAPGTAGGTELFDSRLLAGAVSRGQPLCAFMRILFASCSTVIPPSIAHHLELDSPFMFYFFCRLAEIPGLDRIDALAISRGDGNAIDEVVNVIQEFIGCERISDVCLESAVTRAKRLRRPGVFRFQDIRRGVSASQISGGNSPVRKSSPTKSPVHPGVVPPKSSSVPNAFPRSSSTSSSLTKQQRRGSSSGRRASRQREHSRAGKRRSRSMDSGRRAPAWTVPGVFLQASAAEAMVVQKLGSQTRAESVFQGMDSFQVESESSEEKELSSNNIFSFLTDAKDKIRSKLRGLSSSSLPEKKSSSFSNADDNMPCSILAWDEHILSAVQGHSMDPLRRLVKNEPMPASRRLLIWWLLSGCFKSAGNSKTGTKQKRHQSNGTQSNRSTMTRQDSNASSQASSSSHMYPPRSSASTTAAARNNDSNLHQKFSSCTASAADDYAKLAAAALKDPPEVADVILADVPRTMEAQGWQKIGCSETILTRLLFAYARRNPRLGYCQGMHLMAATLLAVTDERSAFYILAHIVEDIMPSDYYSNLDGTLTDRDVMLDLSRRFHPTLLEHLDQFGISDVSIFTLPWIMSIFANLFPPYSLAAATVVDAVLVGGSSVLFRLALSVLGMCEGALLRIKDVNEVKFIFQRFALGHRLPPAPLHLDVSSPSLATFQDDIRSSDRQDADDSSAAAASVERRLSSSTSSMPPGTPPPPPKTSSDIFRQITDFELAESVRTGCWRFEAVTPKLLATARANLRRLRMKDRRASRRLEKVVREVQGEFIAIVHGGLVEFDESYFK